jgi:hypothetical protein
MISNENLYAIQKQKFLKFLNNLIPFTIFVFCFLSSYSLNITYAENTQLVNDKLIDVSSIFFGVFIGCLYLFEKFKNENTFKRFLDFCKRLLYLNVIIITMSFVVILTDQYIPELIEYNKFGYLITVKWPALIFALYISIFGITLYNIWRFIKIMLIVLKYR